MNVVAAELESALRDIGARPGFAALVVGVLGAGMACVIFMLVMVNGFILRGLPFEAPQQLLHAGLAGVDGGSSDLDQVEGRDLPQMQRHLEGLAEVAGFSQTTINLSDIERPERHEGAWVTTGLWRTLRVAPMLGRDFSTADGDAGAAPVVMLSDALWRQRYGADPAIIGRQVRVNGEVASVIGVMPPDFSYPHREAVWLPATLSEDDTPQGRRPYTAVLRRADTAAPGALDGALANWFADASQAQPERMRGLRVGVQPLVHLAVDPTLRALLGIMLAAVVCVLLVACANAANLLLTRTLARRQELAVRVALGASHSRLVVHLLVQSLLLSLIATALALPLAVAGVAWQDAAFRLSDNGPPFWVRLDIDAAVIGMVATAAVLTALLSGILPALRSAGTAVADGLRDGSRSVAGGAFARVSRILVVGEIALSCVLLISVGTMVRGIAAIDRIDLGIDTGHLLTARVALPENAYPTGAEQLQLYDRLLERLRAEPDVVAASAGSVLPARVSSSREVLAAGVHGGDGAAPRVRFGAVDDDFLPAWGVTLQQGRFFDGRDTAAGERVAVVDRRFAERFGGDAGVVGQRFRLDPRDADGSELTVVGVIAPLTLNRPGGTPEPTLLVPLRQHPSRVASVAVRTRGEPNAFALRLNEAMRATDADTPLYWVRDYAALIHSVTYGERVIAQWFGVFGLVALVLAGAGLYGVMAFGVGQRTREIGVRRALGAPAARVLRNLFARSFLQLGIGLALGLALGIPFMRLLTGWLSSIETGGGMVVLGALCVLLLAALLAVAVPARRALRVDPMSALRHD